VAGGKPQARKIRGGKWGNFPPAEATINHRQAPGHISIYELLAELIFHDLPRAVTWARMG